MTVISEPSSGSYHHHAHAGDEPSWLHPALVIGWIVKGIVYGLVGFLAAQVAFGNSTGRPDQTGALQQIAEQPMGGVLLWAVAAGLALYTAGRMTEAWYAKDESTAKRIGTAAKAALYGVVAVTAAGMASGSSSGGGSGKTEESLTAKVLDAPGGQLIVGAVGVALIGYSLYQVWRALSKKFVDDLDLDRANGTTRTTLERLGQVGIAARGVATALIGWFVLDAAIQHEPSKANSLDEALLSLADSTWGKVGLAIVAFGFMAYGVVCIAHARYRRPAT